MTMRQPTPKPKPDQIADNARAWPSLAYLLAPGAGCDCQMLALSLADGLERPTPASDRAARKQ